MPTRLTKYTQIPCPMKRRDIPNWVTPFVNQQYEYVTTNDINMKGFTLQNVGKLTNAKDVATKEYVDNSGVLSELL